MQAVIMAGGKGTRLSAITKDLVPKPMVELNNKPILQWQIETLRDNGINKIILIIGHLGEIIKNYFKNGEQWNVQISYIEEKEPLGTAGALFYLKSVMDEDFFLIFGDLLFDIDMQKMYLFHKTKKAKVTLFVHPNSHPFDSDLILANKEQRVIGFDSKNNKRDYWYDNCVNAGIYIVHPSICDKFEGPYKMDLEKDILFPLIDSGDSVYAYFSPEYVKDIGTVERLLMAEVEMKRGYVRELNLKYPQKAIFLDRDGTINKKNGLIFQEKQFELETGVVEAIRLINKSRFLAIVITNQPVVARGLCDIDDVENIHNKLKTLLGQQGVYLDDIKFCPHHPDKGYPEENVAYKINCNCRKPGIALLEECVRQYHIDLAESWFIGDATVDVRTGKNAGVKTILLQTGDAGLDGKYHDKPDYICNDLEAAVQLILRSDQNEF